ncbi:25769_t:CDS:1, partial [Gigaspora rosea]
KPQKAGMVKSELLSFEDKKLLGRPQVCTRKGYGRYISSRRSKFKD